MCLYLCKKSSSDCDSNKIFVDVQGATGWIVIQALHQEVLSVKSSHQEFPTETHVLSPCSKRKLQCQAHRPEAYLLDSG